MNEEDGLAILCRIFCFHRAITCASWLMPKTIKYLTVSISVRDKYTCVMFLTFSFGIRKKQQVKEKSEAAKAYVSASESDSDEHEVLGI